jgi:hypothetical protein
MLEATQKGGERVQKWTGRDLNPRLPPCEGGDHTKLIYRPFRLRFWNRTAGEEVKRFGAAVYDQVSV